MPSPSASLLPLCHAGALGPEGPVGSSSLGALASLESLASLADSYPGCAQGCQPTGSSMEGCPGLSVCAVTSSHRLPEGSTPGLCVPPEPPGKLTQAAGYASGRLFFCRHLFSLLLALFPPAPGTFQHPTAQTEFPGGAKTWETGVLPLLLGSPADTLPPLVVPGVLFPGSSRLFGVSRRLGDLTWLPWAWGCEEPDPCR